MNPFPLKVIPVRPDPEIDIVLVMRIFDERLMVAPALKAADRPDWVVTEYTQACAATTVPIGQLPAHDETAPAEYVPTAQLVQDNTTPPEE